MISVITWRNCKTDPPKHEGEYLILHQEHPGSGIWEMTEDIFHHGHWELHVNPIWWAKKTLPFTKLKNPK